MKKIISILLFACAGALAACDFLDVVPEGQATQEDIFKTSKEARKYLNTLYTYAPNIAAYRYMPDFCAGDDIITATNGQTRYFPYKSMLYNEENASQTYYGLWDATTSSPSGRTNYDMYKGIRYCYIMIDNIDAVPGISPSVADEFKGEAYFLIAYYHWVLLTHYGPVILVRGQLDMGLPEEQVYVARSPFDECVTFIAETYDRAADLLHGYPTRPDADLGRATSVAAKAMKARLLLYAASPLCNGNTEFYARFRNNDGTPLMSQTYNPEKWKWALDACQEAITLAEDNGHRLYESPNATAAATAAERGEINYHDCFVEPLWNTTEYLWAMGDQTGIGHLQRYGEKKVLGLFGGSDAVVKVSYDDGKREKKPQPRREAPAQPKKQAQRSDKPQKAEKQSAPRAAKADKPRAPKADKPARAPKADKPREKATVQLSDADLNSACLYLKRLIEGLQVEDPQVAGILKDGLVEITIDCEDYGIIIGHRGETLDALQYLTSLQIKKQTDKYVRVALNVGNYREKRQETLKNLAKKNAAYVLRTGKRYTFEPMNPYERRILHTAIQEVEGVTSRSIGVDQNRRVVLEPEGGVTNTGSDRERYNRGSRGGRRGGNRSAGSKPAAAPKADRADLPKFGKIEVPKKESPAEEAAPAAPTAE